MAQPVGQPLQGDSPRAWPDAGFQRTSPQTARLAIGLRATIIAPEQLHHSPVVGGGATRPPSYGKRPRFRKRKPGPMSSSRRFGAISDLSGTTHSPPPWRFDREAETAWQEQRPRRRGRVESVAPCNHSAIDSEDDVIVPPAAHRKGAGRHGTAQAFGARAASWNPPLPARSSARCRSASAVRIRRPSPTSPHTVVRARPDHAPSVPRRAETTGRDGDQRAAHSRTAPDRRTWSGAVLTALHAEAVGFEPTVTSLPRRFSRPALFAQPKWR